MLFRSVLENFDAVGSTQHDKFLELYRKGNWILAEKFAKDLKQCWNGALNTYYDMMLERIVGNTPPENWDGVYRATTK